MNKEVNMDDNTHEYTRSQKIIDEKILFVVSILKAKLFYI